ncbi:hypothetical protein FDP41_007119 [Naegleria fowleri]|uniref:B box-type domain-containing protein n=1 Tax=Naegleria fowleri TaxID=5763 RepID=A0A6A5BG22_NAEFO|nr:uncharacterized protein FDP41_007119 [Naegleria fowleri]KAF0973732.1 hypothetical protein FDP41_007119 [Naegleria fowleri]CAG4712458.1 unnamed protein product [Naegleria fowleri]
MSTAISRNCSTCLEEEDEFIEATHCCSSCLFPKEHDVRISQNPYFCALHARRHSKNNHGHMVVVIVTSSRNSTSQTPSDHPQVITAHNTPNMVNNDNSPTLSSIIDHNSFSNSFSLNNSSNGGVTNHSPTSVNSIFGIPTCSLHQCPINVYCRNCEKLICAACTLEKHHRGHSSDLLSNIEKEEKEKFKIQHTSLKESIKNWEQVFSAQDEDLRNELKNIEMKKIALKDEVDQIFEILKDVLKQRQEELHSKIEKLCENNCQLIEKIIEMKDETNETLSYFNDLDEMNGYEFMEKRMNQFKKAMYSFEHLKTQFESIGKLEQLHDMKLVNISHPIEMINNQIQNMGDVLMFEYAPIDPQSCKILEMDKIQNHIWKCKQTLSFTLMLSSKKDEKQTENKKLEGSHSLIPFINCFIETQDGMVLSRCSSIKEKNPDQLYKKEFQIQIQIPDFRDQTNLRLAVMIDRKRTRNKQLCQHIYQSPFKLNVIKDDGQKHSILLTDLHYIQTIGSSQNPSSKEGFFNMPNDVKLSLKHGLFFVADFMNKRIQAFNINTKTFKFKFNTNDKPKHVAIDSVDDSIIVSCDDHCIYKYSIESKKLIWKLGTPKQPSSNAQHFNSPYGLVVDDSDGNVFICDCLNHRIQVYSREGKFLYMFGNNNGSQNVQFNGPFAIDINNMGRLVIADYWNQRIVEVSKKGDCCFHVFGGGWKGNVELGHPIGVVVDKRTGNMLVCDEENLRVQYFTPQGEYLKTFQPRNGEQGFGKPFRLCFNSLTGEIFVVDCSQHRIQVYK